MSLITVATYDNDLEAGLAMSMLEAEGIRAWVHDDALARLSPLYARVIGGVKLRVAEVDAARALDALATIVESAGTSFEIEDPEIRRMFEQAEAADRAGSERELPAGGGRPTLPHETSPGRIPIAIAAASLLAWWLLG